jgi:hypothetical protein
MQATEDPATAAMIDSASAPALVLQLSDGNQNVQSNCSSTTSDNGSYNLMLDCKMSYKKTDKLPSQILNTSLTVAICLADPKEELAKGTVDLMPLCLGSNSLDLDLKLEPCSSSSPYRVGN